MKCAYCKEVIDDDSWYCDQCGKQIMFCPECHQPRRGTECPACGADLVIAQNFHFSTSKDNDSQQSTTAKSGSPTLLESEGFRLPLKEGVFGRTTGVYPEFSNQIYISRQHGELRLHNGQWQIRDIGSTNHTFLNGMELTAQEWYDLHVGDKLKIATTVLTVK